MALPPSFQNSFWTPDFKLDTLWRKINAGVVENQEILKLVTVGVLSIHSIDLSSLLVLHSSIVQLICLRLPMMHAILRCDMVWLCLSCLSDIVILQERANTSTETAKALYDIAETRLKNNGFGYGEGASLRRTFEGELSVALTVSITVALCISHTRHVKKTLED